MHTLPVTAFAFAMAFLVQGFAQPLGPARQPALPEGATVLRDLAYVSSGHERQKLDLYLPKDGTNLPLIINIHGGAFKAGSKEQGVPLPYLAQSYAVASINYRLSHHAKFPAQIEDCKAAVRWLRAHATEYRLDSSRFASWGSSAGGHLAAMLGTTGDTKAFDLGENLDQSGRVQAVVDYFGPTDFLQMDAHRLPDGMLHDPANSPESELIGGPIQENKEKTARANPITYITSNCPPFLICHGDQDPLVPHHQSVLLEVALKQAGVPVAFYTVQGAGHGGFRDPQVPQMTREFLAGHLQKGTRSRKPADYAVVVSQATQADTQWRAVVEALCAKHQAATIVYANSVREALPKLREQFPRYACFVATPGEATREFVASVHQLTRQLDDDPCTDCFWGILTGYDAANALRTAKHTEPLTVRKVASGTEVALEKCEAGVWYCELNKNKMVKKEKGGSAQELKGPDDTTEALVKTLAEYQADCFVTSGHATERDWQIGYRYRNGQFRCADGVLYGLDTKGARFPVQSPNPKVFLPIGNCLMGHIDGKDAMALAFMNSAGVHQMIGYTVTSWYGYAGWGCLDYFIEQPGRYTFAEAFFANQAALIHRLQTYFPEAVVATNWRTAKVTDEAKAAGLNANDARGLVYDRDTVAFYGDPAWVARMAPGPNGWEQTLTEKDGTWTFVIQPNQSENSFKPVNQNGSQRGWRPFVQFLPQRIKDIKVIAGAELKPVITDNFILVPNPRECNPARKYQVVFRASPMD